MPFWDAPDTDPGEYPKFPENIVLHTHCFGTCDHKYTTKCPSENRWHFVVVQSSIAIRANTA